MAAIQGLSCPSCAGSVAVQDAERLVTCSACGTALLVQGDVGHPRFHVRLATTQAAALQAVRRFWTGFDKARDLAQAARLSEVFAVFVPVWRTRALVAGFVLGDERQGSGKDKRYVPVERRVLQRYDRNRSAADLGDLGIKYVELSDDALLPFDPEAMERQGRIFQPLTPAAEDRGWAERVFVERAKKEARVDRVRFAVLNLFSVTQSLVYYPLWVVRYEYRQRTYQVTVDGARGELLYGRAPGNDLYRALALVVGVMGGNFVLTTGFRSGFIDDTGSLVMVLGLAGLLIYSGFKAFRYGAEITKAKRDPWGSG